MGKRKLEAVTEAIASPSKKLAGILKTEKTPAKVNNKSVTFPPPDELGETLKLLAKGQLDEGEVSLIIGLLENVRGPSLVMWLDAFQANITVLGRHKSDVIDGLVMELLKLKWADQGQGVVRAYKSFIVNLVSANTRYTRAAIKSLIGNFKGGVRESDSDVFKNTHDVLKGLLSVSPVGARDEILEQINLRFPFYKQAAYRQVCYISAVVEMSGYVADSRMQVLCMLMEKLIKLDANLSRDFIDEAYRARDEEMRELDNQVLALDLFMNLMFTYIHGETHVLEEYNHDKAVPVVDCFMKIFSTHVLPTFNIVHTQFLYLYLASLSPTICSRFLLENWRIFSNPNTPSILRQTAMAYIASFLSRASFAPVNLVMTYLDRITSWAMSYIRSRETQASGLDFMYTDLNHHGPFYSACQAIFYVFAFRHTELTTSETRMKTLQGMSWQSLVTSHLNPLRVCLPGVVRNFSAIARGYQLAYCTSIIQRNSRINLPVVGSLSQASSKGKPLLLDCFFPFDPYLLEETKDYVGQIYRPYTGEIIADSDEEESSDDESEEDEVDTPDSGLGRKRRERMDSYRSSISSCGRTKRDSVGCLNDLLMQDLVPASPGFA
eukprot:TRINITY_DN4634_c0_g1_i1.p1 TRINITY_DN4634_c0_g1~~TRINITY_DN4634_c0_g1_i1.p1  ORF type:complete len:607 (-),score=189.84 TRINITY_DN4634_c0_g1_i1:118-1938(-)